MDDLHKFNRDKEQHGAWIKQSDRSIDSGSNPVRPCIRVQEERTNIRYSDRITLLR
jgi:hypothetical protein